MNFIQGALVSSSLKFSGRLIFILSQIIIARKFGPAFFGAITFEIMLLRFFGQLAVGGMNISIMKEAFKEKNASPRTGISLLTPLVYGGISLLIYLILHGLGVVESYIFPFIIPLFAYLLVIGAYSTRNRNSFYEALYNDILPFGLIIPMILFIEIDEPNDLMVFYLISFLLTFVLSNYVNLDLKYVFRNLKFNFKYIRNSFVIGITATVSMLSTFIDRWVVENILGEFELGIYQSSFQISSALLLVSAGINIVSLSLTGEIFALPSDEVRSRVGRFFKERLEIGLALTLPATILVVIWPQQILELMFGQEYVSASVSLQILTLGKFFNIIFGSVGLLLMMSGRQNMWLAVSSCAAILNLLVTYIGTTTFGIVGAAVGSTISLVLLYITGFILVNKNIGAISLAISPRSLALSMIPLLALFLPGLYQLPTAILLSAGSTIFQAYKISRDSGK